MSPRDTLRSSAPELPPEAVGGRMLARQARHLAATLYERGVAAVPTKLDALAWVVRVPPADARRAEPIVFGFLQGVRYSDSERSR